MLLSTRAARSTATSPRRPTRPRLEKDGCPQVEQSYEYVGPHPSAITTRRAAWIETQRPSGDHGCTRGGHQGIPSRTSASAARPCAPGTRTRRPIDGDGRHDGRIRIEFSRRPQGARRSPISYKDEPSRFAGTTGRRLYSRSPTRWQEVRAVSRVVRHARARDSHPRTDRRLVRRVDSDPAGADNRAAITTIGGISRGRARMGQATASRAALQDGWPSASTVASGPWPQTTTRSAPTS